MAKNTSTASPRQKQSGTPLTDDLIAEIAARLTWHGSRAAAARYAGLSRQNFGKWIREKGVPRESETLLRLDEFSRMSRPSQEEFLPASRRGSHESSPRRGPGPAAPSARPPSPGEDSGVTGLPPWML